MFFFIAFLIGVYLTGAFFIFLTAAGDADGRFKYKYVFLWPIYIGRLFKGEYP